MEPDYKSLWSQVTGPADAATVLLAGSLGFVLDAGLNVVGFFSPGTVGVTAAGAALGAKKGWEARRAHINAMKRAHKARHRATETMELFRGRGYDAGVVRLEAELELYDRGLTANDALDRALDDILATYRASLGGAPGQLNA